MDPTTQREQPQLKFHGETDFDPYFAKPSPNRPIVYPKSDREYVIEWNGEFKRYRDGQEVPVGSQPKG